MACGLVPIISNSPISATKQFARNEKSLFKCGDSSDLAKKIDYWIEHEDEKNACSKEYVDYVQNYNIKESIVQFEEMLQTAINENNAK